MQIVPSVGQNIYENYDGDADGDGESGKDIKRTGGNMTKYIFTLLVTYM